MCASLCVSFILYTLRSQVYICTSVLHVCIANVYLARIETKMKFTKAKAVLKQVLQTITLVHLRLLLSQPGSDFYEVEFSIEDTRMHQLEYYMY